MRNAILCAIVFVLVATSAAWCANVCTGDLSELIDFGKLPYLRDSICTQVSSFDRTGGNDDGGTYSFLRIENGNQVLFDADGPGCIYRLWTASPTYNKKLEFYFDGSDKPGLVFDDWHDMYKDKVFPFLTPLSQNFIGGWCSYVPIPFKKHCKIVDYGKAGYLQITWQKFASAKGVQTFSTNYSASYRAKFEKVKNAWLNPGAAPWGPTPARWQVKEVNVVVQPGKSANLLKLAGAGVVRALYVTPQCDDMRFYRECILKVSTDSQAKPKVWSPIGDFFLDGFGGIPGKSIIIGKNGGEYYSYWPMPFAGGVGIDVVNEASNELRVKCKVLVEPMHSLPAGIGRFYAWWHRQNPEQMGKGFEMLTATGKGHFCGVNHYMQAPRTGLGFLEGDEMLWVDNRDNTYYNGTGTEDYFCGGWYFHEESACAPLYGSLLVSGVGGVADAYRFQLADCVPFQNKIHAEIEHGDQNNYPSDYSGVTYFYGEPTLKHTFEPVAAEDRIMAPKKSENAFEAENAFRGGGPDVGKVECPNRALHYSEYEAVASRSSKPGAWIDFRFNFDATSYYEIRSQVACTPESGIVALFIDGKQVGAPVDCYSAEPKMQVKTFAPSTGLIKAGRHAVTFKVVGKSDNAKSCDETVDIVFIERIGLIECEMMKLLSVKDGKAEAQSMGHYGGKWSNNAQMGMDGGVGSSFEFELPAKTAGHYTLGAYLGQGPDYGIFRLSLDGKEVKKPSPDGKEVQSDIDLFNPDPRRADLMRFTGQYDLRAGKHVLKVEIVGKRPESKGYHVGLDAISLEPAGG